MPKIARITLFLSLVVLAGVVGGTAGAGVYLASGGGRILPQVTVARLPLGGLTRPQARRVLADYDRRVVQRPVLLTTPGRTLSLQPRDFGLGLDVEATVSRAYQVGRRGSLPARGRTLLRLWSGGVAVDPVLRGGEKSLRRFLTDLAADLEQPPRNARFDPATGRLTPEAEGREVALTESQRLLWAAFAGAGERLVTLVVHRVAPAVTLAELRRAGVRQLLSSYTTRFDPGDANRVHNLSLAARTLDGALLQPGQVLSFNRTTGPRSEARGYRPAYEIVREKYVIGIGGGTCQVSSTFYNAALLAGLQVTERTAHSQPLGYVPPGRDATVYDGLIDLKVRNNRSRSVVIAATVGRDTLTVAVCGQREDFPEVRLELGPLAPVDPGPEQAEVDPALPPGQRQVVEEARLGYRVKLFRHFYRGGTQVASELISEDYYPPQARRVKLGPPPAKVGPLEEKPLPNPPRTAPSASHSVDLSTGVLYN